MIERVRRHSWSIQAQFLLYSLGLVLPALIFSGLMFLRSAALERDSMEREVRDVVRSVTLTIDRELATSTTTLKALASSPALADGDLKAFYGQAIAAQEVGGDHFFLTSLSGKQLLNTRAPWGAELPPTSAGNFKDVIKSGKVQVSNLYRGLIANAPIFSISVPVKRRTRTVYVLSASISPSRILDILNREQLDAGRVATVADRNGVIIARSRDWEKYLGQLLRNDASNGANEAGLRRTTDNDGVPVLQATTYSQLSGWMITTTVPVAVANQPIVRSWALVATLGASFALLSALLAYLFGSKFTEPVRKLVQGAGELGRGETVKPIRSSIREIQAVSEALVEASERRRVMEQFIRDGEDRLRLALTSAGTGTWDWDIVGGVLTWDQRMRELWGLGPDEPVTFEAFLARLHPQDRGPTLAAIERARDPADAIEYDVEHRVCASDGLERWVAMSGRAQFADGAAVRMTGTALDISERKKWEEHTQLLMREITHRSKNLLAVIQAMARQSKIGSKTVADFEARFSGRLQALAASHDLLVQRDWHGVPISELVQSQLGHYLDEHESQIEIAGQKLIVTPEAAQNIGLAVHELSTNAAKYGALSVPQGHVTVRWSCTDADSKDARFRMVWTEKGGPAVAPPSHKGFGQVVMEQLAARALQGEASLRFEAQGVSWTLDIPASHVLWREPARGE
jgi:PAS domain S-box-containing protein